MPSKSPSLVSVGAVGCECKEDPVGDADNLLCHSSAGVIRQEYRSICISDRQLVVVSLCVERCEVDHNLPSAHRDLVFSIQPVRVTPGKVRGRESALLHLERDAIVGNIADTAIEWTQSLQNSDIHL